MLLDEGLAYHKNPYGNPLRERARTFFMHRDGDQSLIDKDIAELETWLRKEAKQLVANGHMNQADVEANIQRALSIVRGAVSTARYNKEKLKELSPTNPRVVGAPSQPRRKRTEWVEELDEEEGDYRTKPTSSRTIRTTPARVRGATQNTNSTEENEMAKDILTRDEAATALKISKGHVRVLWGVGILKGKDANNITKASVEARNASVRNIGTRSVLGLGGVGGKEKPAKAEKAPKSKATKASKKKVDAVSASRAVPKPTRTKKERKPKGEGLPEFTAGEVTEVAYEPVE